jgi:hypothetical protein
LKVMHDGRPVTVEATADGAGLVSHAGTALLAQVADRLGLTRALSLRLAGVKQRRRGHDPGRVIRDLAVMLADGGECVSDLAVTREQESLLGAVASDSTAFRIIARIAAVPDLVDAIRAAHARARDHAWRLAGAPEGLTIDIDATLITSHSEQEGVAGNYKGGYGFFPLHAYADQTREALGAALPAVARRRPTRVPWTPRPPTPARFLALDRRPRRRVQAPQSTPSRRRLTAQQAATTTNRHRRRAPAKACPPTRPKPSDGRHPTHRSPPRATTGPPHSSADTHTRLGKPNTRILGARTIGARRPSKLKGSGRPPSGFTPRWSYRPHVREGFQRGFQTVSLGRSRRVGQSPANRETSKTKAIRQSPLTDSNRRPLPYHRLRRG